MELEDPSPPVPRKVGHLVVLVFCRRGLMWVGVNESTSAHGFFSRNLNGNPVVDSTLGHTRTFTWKQPFTVWTRDPTSGPFESCSIGSTNPIHQLRRSGETKRSAKWMVSSQKTQKKTASKTMVSRKQPPNRPNSKLHWN